MVAFLRATLGFEPEIMREGWSEVYFRAVQDDC